MANDRDLKWLKLLKEKDDEIAELKAELKETDNELNIINLVWCALYDRFPDISDNIKDIWFKYYGDKTGKSPTQIIGELKAGLKAEKAKGARLYELLKDAKLIMQHSRSFIASRQTMYVTGIKMYDDLIEKIAEVKGE